MSICTKKATVSKMTVTARKGMFTIKLTKLGKQKDMLERRTIPNWMNFTDSMISNATVRVAGMKNEIAVETPASHRSVE